MKCREKNNWFPCNELEKSRSSILCGGLRLDISTLGYPAVFAHFLPIFFFLSFNLLFLSLSLTHTHTHTHTHTTTCIRFFSQIAFKKKKLCGKQNWLLCLLTQSLSLSLSLSPYHTHTHIHTHTHTDIYIHTHKLAFSHTHTHTHTFFLSHFLWHTVPTHADNQYVKIDPRKFFSHASSKNLFQFKICPKINNGRWRTKLLVKLWT